MKDVSIISKTAMLPLVKELRWKQVRDGLIENRDLIGVRDKRGRTWLHLACGVDITKRPAAAVRDSIKLCEILLERGLDTMTRRLLKRTFVRLRYGTRLLSERISSSPDFC